MRTLGDVRPREAGFRSFTSVLSKSIDTTVVLKLVQFGPVVSSLAPSGPNIKKKKDKIFNREHVGGPLVVGLRKPEALALILDLF